MEFSNEIANVKMLFCKKSLLFPTLAAYSMLSVSRAVVHNSSSSYKQKTQSTMDTNMINLIKSCIPSLDSNKHKGQSGRIGVIGGSLEYTGAPYFAGISALKVGADLVHVFCASAAATVIKSYSPELIVHPLLDQPNATKDISPWLDRIHALVIGPGLGRDPKIFKVVSELISVTREKNIPLVIDADGLFLITENPDLIKDYPSPGVILTPNKIEFERMQSKMGFGDNVDTSSMGKYVTVMKKGSEDQVFSSSKDWMWKSGIGGSGRRCGGQGDLLSGSTAIFLHWMYTGLQENNDTQLPAGTDKSITAASLSCYAASRLVRLCNEKAFKIKGRSMLASDMIEQIHTAFEELYGQ